MSNLSFEYPAWFLLLCAFAGLVVALLLYYRDRTFHEQASWLVALMGIFRWLGYSLVAALLLSPLLRYLQTDRQEPVVVLARDVSESVLMQTDSNAYAADWEALKTELEQQYQIAEYTFGDKKTNLDALLTEVGDTYGSQNLGAVVLATDGIYNEGSNPAYRDFQFRAPVFTVGMGDTTRRRDLLIRRVFHNKIAYLNDRFSIQVDVAARNADGESTRLSVSRVGEGGNRSVFSENLRIEGDDFFTTREIVIDADRPGVQRYRVSLADVGQEVTATNNRRDIFVDVLDARQKVLLLTRAPHPDVTALRQALNKGKNNEVEVANADDFNGNFGGYDLVILHELPAFGQNLPEIKVPTLFVLGEDSPLETINRVQDLVTITGPPGTKGNEVSARPLAGFNLFTISDELRRGLPNFPPLTAPFGEYQLGNGANVVLRQKIGRVDTEYPLLVVGESRGVRTGVLTGSGLWQWRLFDFLDQGNHDRFDEFLSQLTQYLTVADDKRRFRVSLPKNIFDENEAVRFDAELYNSNYELINDPEANLVVTGPGGQEYTYLFTRTANAYTLDAGRLPVGDYRYRATTANGGEELAFNGRFSVRPVEVERYALEADHNLLRRLSERFGGELLFPDQLASLPARLEAGGTVKPVLFETVNTRSILNLRWIFFGLLALFAAEWFLRRYFGGY